MSLESSSQSHALEDVWSETSPSNCALERWKLKPTILKPQSSVCHHWCYVGVMTSKQAEQTLANKEGDCYFIRFSNIHQKYMLSVSKKSVDDTVIYGHYPINITTKYDFCEYEIEGSEKKFDDITELLHYYEENPLTDEIENLGMAFIFALDCSNHTPQGDKTVLDSPFTKGNKYILLKHPVVLNGEGAGDVRVQEVEGTRVKSIYTIISFVQHNTSIGMSAYHAARGTLEKKEFSSTKVASDVQCAVVS